MLRNEMCIFCLLSFESSDFLRSTQNWKKSSSWFERLLSKCTKHEVDCANFCVLLKVSELYKKRKENSNMIKLQWWWLDKCSLTWFFSSKYLEVFRLETWYSSPPQLPHPQLRYFCSYTILNWIQKNLS